MPKVLIIVGVILILVGVVWPWLSKLGIGHLPGDIYVQRKNFSFYFPITSCIVVSVLISLIFWIFRR